LISQKNFYY